MQAVIQTLESYGRLSSATKQAFSEALTRKELHKGTILLEEGKICKSLGIIEQGLARYYGYKDGKEITFNFSFETDLCFSPASFYSQKPSYEYIELLEDSVIHFIDHQQLDFLFETHLRLNLNFRKIIESYYVELEDYVYLLQNFSTKERYLHLLDYHPDFFNRVSLTHIASFLGMTKENLSRIRKSMNQK